MKRQFVTLSIKAGALLGLLIVSLHGCTNLDETPVSVITPGTFFRNEAEVQAALAGVYAQLRSTAPEGPIYDANEVSTDEIVVPIRGPDWIDNGQWIDLHDQTWTPTSAAASNFFNSDWNNAYTGVARANLFLASVAPITVPNKATYLAEGRALRAFYYYILMDFFGGVPIVTDPTDHALHPRNTRREVFDFIESELIAARDSGLPATWNAANNGRFTKGAADAILANMYLNAGVYTKDAAGGTGINATGYNSCASVTVTGGDACAAAIAAADRILTSGNYALADSFPQMFRADNANSRENIFVVKFINKDQLGLGIDMATLHYCQYHDASPWNGFATLAQTYRAFDPADQRRRVILIGPQVDVLTGTPATVRSGGSCPVSGGTPLVFTDTIGKISDASEGEGPRIYKWPADPAHVAQNSGNDYAWFRLGEIYLIKAEAQHVLGQDGPALIVLNKLRARTDPVAPPLAAVSDSVILRERLFELFGEVKRRQDLVRFGKFTNRTDAASGLVGGKVASADYYVLMPIPQTQISANPLLSQNPGY